MNNKNGITTLFTDIGGVLLTNGWNRDARKNAAISFNLNFEDMEERHHLTFDTYEEGKLSLNEYLDRVVFYKKRDFGVSEFRDYMFAQSKPFTEMIRMVRWLKNTCRLKVIVVSNEGRELSEYRIKEFRLHEFVDAFICSSFVHLRKPDVDIFQMALDISQVSPANVLYIEDRPMFVQVAESLGIKGIYHTDYQSTIEKLSLLGFNIADESPN